MYAVRFLPAAEGDLDAIAEPTYARIRTAILALADTPRPVGVVKMEGSRGRYRIRIGGYRVVYEIHDKQLLVIVVAIADRGQIYRLLKRR